MTQFSLLGRAESRVLAGDIRELFDDLAASLHHEKRAYSGEFQPSIDVLETDQAVEIVVDVCGVPPEALRVLFRGGVVIVAGEKAPLPPDAQQTFHLVEREFGRFARAVQVNGAFDVPRARATMAEGELRIVLPKHPERRGRAHRIGVQATAPPDSGSRA